MCSARSLRPSAENEVSFSLPLNPSLGPNGKTLSAGDPPIGDRISRMFDRRMGEVGVSLPGVGLGRLARLAEMPIGCDPVRGLY